MRTNNILSANTFSTGMVSMRLGSLGPDCNGQYDMQPIYVLGSSY